MTAIQTFVVILLSLLDAAAPLADHRSRKGKRISNQKELCSNRNLCSRGSKTKATSRNQEMKQCLRNTDCAQGQYCHEFHRLCLRPQETITVAPVKTSAKRCGRDSNCQSQEYCHEMWKICLASRTVYKGPPTKRPTWYCESSNDCRIDQQCHKGFHACYSGPRVAAVRRSTSISLKCTRESECGPNYYCHDHFRICLPKLTPMKMERKWKTKTCMSNEECQSGMECHALWKICFKPAPNVVGRGKTARRCQYDSDCKTKEYCHVMGGGKASAMAATVARLRRNIDSICLSLSWKLSQNVARNTICKTNEECGPNQCCLKKLGVCLAYKLPGEMCLREETDFVCPCVTGSFCRARGKLASPKRIINKMKLSDVASEHLMSNTHKRKYKIGKCIPGSSS